MKHFCLLLLVLSIIIIVGSNESSTTAPDPSTFVKYHGTRRYWTSIDSTGKTYTSLNALKEAATGPIKLLFPKDKNMAQILRDITLYSPTNAEDECKTDTKTLEFKFLLDDQNYIHGKVSIFQPTKKIKADMYETCPGGFDAILYTFMSIDEQAKSIEGPERNCFKNENPFKPYDKESTKNVMVLEVFGSFRCQVFMVLPSYMDVEDEVLSTDTREPLNETFAAQGEDFWWKDSNNESFSDGILFVGMDAVIDITNSTQAIPYFLRIGKGQPYPSLRFKFDANCSNQQYELYINLRSGGDCRIGLVLTENGYTLTTKGVTSEIQDATKSPTLVLARGQSKVYVKAGTHLSVISKEVCQIENPTDVPDDQLVIQIAPSKSSDVCNTAQIILPANDIKGKIEVLLDRVKAAALIPETGSTESSYSTSPPPVKSTSSPARDTTKTATAGFPWWWILAGILISAGLVAGLIGIWLYIRHRRNQSSTSSKSKKNNGQKAGKKGKSHSKPKAETVVIPVEEPPPPKDKEGKMDNKNNGKNAKQQAAEQEIGGSKKSAKQSRKEPKNHYETLPANPPNQGPPRTPKRQSEAQTTQDDPTLETGSTQPASSIVQTRKSHMSSDYINQK